MLIHSVWEDVLIWSFLQVALISLARKSPQSRYLTACVALVAMAALPWLTFNASDLSAFLKNAHSLANDRIVQAMPVPTQQTFTADNSRSDTERPADSVVFPEDFSEYLARLFPFLVTVWISGLAFASARLWMHWRNARNVLRHPFHLLDPAWRARFERLTQLTGVDKIVKLGESAAVSVPIVAGWLKPIILLPIGAVTALPAEQIEAILLHELAHISRHDYLVNLLQSIVETIFFYHPAIWAVSRRIRLERELACDDQTVQWCKNPRIYAEALAGFEEFRGHPPLLAATGDGDLFARIRRILVGPVSERRSVPIFAAAGLCGIGFYLVSMFVTPMLAEHIMTAQERVTQIQALQQAPDPETTVAPGRGLLAEGTLTTEDGKPLPASMFYNKVLFKGSAGVMIQSQGSLTSQCPMWMENLPEHLFHANARTGWVQIGFWAEGYAPQVQSLYLTKDADPQLKFILKHGFPAQVQIFGSDGQPLKDVVVTASFPRPGTFLQLSMPSVQTDASGLATFGNVEANSEIHLVVSKPGWQMAEQVVSQWTEKTPLQWKLESAKSTSGLVIDQLTRKPISGATIILAARRPTGDSQYQSNSPEDGQVLGHTDATGHFELTNLTKDYSWRIYVQKANYPITTFPIDYGNQNQVCELPPGLHLRGKILDPKGLLAAKDVYHPVVLRVIYSISVIPNGSIGKNQEQTLLKLGPEIPFSFENLPQGGVGIIVTVCKKSGQVYYREDFDLKGNRDNYVFDLSAKSPEVNADTPDPRPLRKVEIVLKAPPGAQPSGVLESSYETRPKPKPDVSWFAQKNLSITGGKAISEFPVPTSIDLNANQLVGYWFAPENVNIPAGTGTLTHDVNVIPAGVIHGHITLPTNITAPQVGATLLTIKPPSDVNEAKFWATGSVTVSPSNDYVTSPLPFGGTYAVMVGTGPDYYVTPLTVVDAEHPLVVQDLNATSANGLLAGKFVDEAGKPIANQEVILTYHPTEHQATALYAAKTDSTGAFAIPQMNFNVPGNYEVQLNRNGGWEQSKIRIDGNTPQPVIITLRKNGRTDDPTHQVRAAEAGNSTMTTSTQGGKTISTGVSFDSHESSGSQAAPAKIKSPRLDWSPAIGSQSVNL